MPTSFNDLVKECTIFHETNYDYLTSKQTLKTRESLSEYIEKFHRDAGTLTNQVINKISDLRCDGSILLMTAHQPNLFPYSGVIRKATLLYALQYELEKNLDIPTVSYFAVADQDFSGDRWRKSSELPDISRKDGVLTLSISIPDDLLILSVSKPDKKKLVEWKKELEKWIAISFSTFKTSSIKSEFSSMRAFRDSLTENFHELWTHVVDSQKDSKNYADFNAFFTSKIINNIWDYDILFSRFSDSQHIFESQFSYLLSNLSEYSNSITEVMRRRRAHMGSKVNPQEAAYAPFWYHCDCGSKSSLIIRDIKNEIIASGKCISCGQVYTFNFNKTNPDLSGIITRISARAMSMILIFSQGLGLTCYVGGTGGLNYLNETAFVADELDRILPPIVVWRPRDKYLGMGQICSVLEYVRIAEDLEKDIQQNIESLKGRIDRQYEEINILNKRKEETINAYRSLDKGIVKDDFEQELKNIINKINDYKKRNNLSVLNHDYKILQNIPKTLNLIPSIIDYALNIGIKKTSDQWISYLRNNGSLVSDVEMDSIFNCEEKIKEYYYKIIDWTSDKSDKFIKTI